MTQTTDHSFKVGGEVFIDTNRYGSQRPMMLVKVEKVTKTQFTAGGIRFRPYRDCGYEIGGGYDARIARPADDHNKTQNAFLVAQQDAVNGLFRIGEAISRMKGQEAIDTYAALPQFVRDLGDAK